MKTVLDTHKDNNTKSLKASMVSPYPEVEQAFDEVIAEMLAKTVKKGNK